MISRRGKGLGLLLAAIAAWAPAASAENQTYSLAADAAVGFDFALPSLETGSAGSAAHSFLQANFLHRLEGRGWSAVLNQSLDLALSTEQSGIGQRVHEAYLSLALGESASLAIGKRRMELGLGRAFAPGDPVNPRTSFWDQKEGFMGFSFAASLGSELSLRAALSLDDNLAAAPAGSADPSLLVGAVSAELLLGRLQLALGGAFSPERIARPSLGLSLDLLGLILQTEWALELAEGVAPYGTAGARYSIYGDAFELSLSLEAAYGRPRGLRNELYLLPAASASLSGLGSFFCRSLLGLEDGSALLSVGLTASPLEDCELELTANFGLGAEGSEFRHLPPSPAMRVSGGLAARIHF